MYRSYVMLKEIGWSASTGMLFGRLEIFGIPAATARIASDGKLTGKSGEP